MAIDTCSCWITLLWITSVARTTVKMKPLFGNFLFFFSFLFFSAGHLVWCIQPFGEEVYSAHKLPWTLQLQHVSKMSRKYLYLWAVTLNILWWTVCDIRSKIVFVDMQCLSFHLLEFVSLFVCLFVCLFPVRFCLFSVFFFFWMRLSEKLKQFCL